MAQSGTPGIPDKSINPPLKRHAHVVTGATGFVGGALVLELLQRTDDLIVCLVRPGEQDPQTRLWQSLDGAVAAYDAPASVMASIRTRVVALAGDVEQAMCGVDLAALPPLNYRTFWHSAASLRFEDRDAELIMRSNVDGTAHALALAAHLNVFDFNYVSTAYVVGTGIGNMPEARQTQAKSQNWYEKSKLAAEELVLGTNRFALRIFRPSVVIGHSRTLAATTFSGLYGLIRQMVRFKGMMARTQEDLLQSEPLRLRVDVGIPVDLVPVDRVVANAVTVWLATQATMAIGEAQFYHLNNPTPPTIDSVLNLIFRMVEILPPKYLTRDDQMHEMQWLDEKFNERIEFYRVAFRNHKIFERHNTARLVGAEDPACYHMPDEVLQRYCDWYLQKLIAESADLPTSR
jgi:nucleoside-diphosphate-sugar epimerase